MKRTFKINLNTNPCIQNYQAVGIDIRKALFFDIETTGFSASHTILYLIGAGYYDEQTDSFQGIQWFNEDGTKEAEILSDFFDFCSHYTVLIHFNGDGFDLPYLQRKAELLSLPFPLVHLTSFDLYKQCRLVKPLLNLDHLKQKNIEAFLQIPRDDKNDGGQLIKLYQHYIIHPDDKSKKLLLLHNHDDITGLLAISPILSYLNLLNGNYGINQLCIKDNTALLKLSLTYPLCRRVSKGKDNFLFTAYKDSATLHIPIYHGELKFFYPNYKDYYYLPVEDTAIHKSIAFYVDKDFRTQAKAATCYSKKNGYFLPQPETVVSPYFKKEYKDSISYFELTDEVCNDYELIKKYAASLLAALLK